MYFPNMVGGKTKTAALAGSCKQRATSAKRGKTKGPFTPIQGFTETAIFFKLHLKENRLH